MKQVILGTLAFLILALVAIAGTVALLAPKNGSRVVMTTGGSEGLYQALAERYRDELKGYGVTLELHPEIDGFNTLKALVVNKNADAGIVKGGFIGGLQGRYATEADKDWHQKDDDALYSLGRLFIEPLWVFVRKDEPLTSFKELKGKTILVGTKSSGARKVVSHLLQASNVSPKDAKLVESELSEDGAELIRRQADVAFLLLPPDAPKIQKLLRNGALRLFSFASEADAYVNRFPYLNKVTLHQGAIELSPDIPETDVTLIGTSAAMVVRKDLDPSLRALLVHAMFHNPKPGFDPTGEPILFYRSGEYPNTNDPELKIAPEARGVTASSELPFFLRALGPLSARVGLPFALTAFANDHGSQVLLLLIPLLSILLPSIRILPTVYNWTIRNRLLFWYRRLKAVEQSYATTPGADQRAAAAAELDSIDEAVSRIRVPLAFSNQLYDLRLHINVVRQRLFEEAAQPKP